MVWEVFFELGLEDRPAVTISPMLKIFIYLRIYSKLFGFVSFYELKNGSIDIHKLPYTDLMNFFFVFLYFFRTGTFGFEFLGSMEKKKAEVTIR